MASIDFDLYKGLPATDGNGTKVFNTEYHGPSSRNPGKLLEFFNITDRTTRNGMKLSLSTKDFCSDGRLVLMVRGPGVNHRHTVFILDSGAAVHVTENYSLFSTMVAVPPGGAVRTANGHTLPITGSGTVVFDGFRLSGVRYVPGLTSNLISVSMLTELDYGVEFLADQCLVKDLRAGGGAVAGKGRRVNGIYEMEFLEIPLQRYPIPQAACTSF